MKIRSVLITLTLLLGGSVHAKIVDRIIAQVNNDIITLSDLKREMEQIRRDLATQYAGEQLEEAAKNAEKDVLEELIRQKLLLQKATELGFGANVDIQVSAYLERIRTQNNLKDMQALEEALAQQGMTMTNYREYLRKQIIIQGLVNEFVGSRITLLTEEVEKYYREHQKDFATPEEVTLSEIVISIDDDPAQVEARAKELHQRISQGEAFATVANQYSKGPTAGKGGSIGTYNPENLNAEISQAIADVKEGEITPVLKSKDSFVIYRVDARKESVTPPMEEIRDKIKELLWEEKFQPEYERFLAQLREEAYIQLFDEIQK